MNLSTCDVEERERAVGADVNDTMLLMAWSDLLDRLFIIETFVVYFMLFIINRERESYRENL
jgi:hypothetical protein